MENFIRNAKNLMTLSFELNELKGSWDLLKAIKDYKGESWTKWRELMFSKVNEEHQEFVNQILANHQEIQKLTFKCGWEQSLFPSVPHLRKISFKFSADDRRAYDDLTKVHLLDFFYFKEDQLQPTFEFLERCPNLKLLMISGRLTPENIQIIFNAVNDLEELRLYKIAEGIAIKEKLRAIKTYGKKLKKLIFVEFEETHIKTFQEIKIFNDSNVQVSVEIHPFFKKKNPGLCRLRLEEVNLKIIHEFC